MGRSVTSPAAIFEAIRGLSTRMGMARIEYHSTALGGCRKGPYNRSLVLVGLTRSGPYQLDNNETNDANFRVFRFLVTS